MNLPIKKRKHPHDRVGRDAYTYTTCGFTPKMIRQVFALKLPGVRGFSGRVRYLVTMALEAIYEKERKK